MKSSNSSPLKTLIDWSFSSCSQNFRALKRAETSPQIALKSVCSSARWCPGCQRISALTFAAIEQRIRNVKIVYVCVSVCVPHSVFHEKKAIFLIYFFIFPANCIRIFSSFSCLQLVFPLFFLVLPLFWFCCCSLLKCILHFLWNLQYNNKQICLCVCGSAQVRESGTQKEKKFYFTLLWLSHFLIVVDKLAVRARAMSKCLWLFMAQSVSRPAPESFVPRLLHAL